MPTPAAACPDRPFHRAARVAALLAAVAVGLVLLGWATGRPALKAVPPGGVPMNPATAVAAGLAALSLALLAGPGLTAGRRAGHVFAWLALVIGLTVLARHLGGWDAGLDLLFFRGALDGSRMAPNTALALTLIGAALALPARPNRASSLAGQLLPLGALGVCGLGLVGYTFGARPLYGVARQVPMAVNTAAVLATLSVGVLLARPRQGVVALLRGGGAGGTLARRLVPAAVGVPWALGWLRLRGEQAGLYDAEFGVALMAVGTIALFLALVWITAASLEAADARRRTAEGELRAAAETVRDLYDNAPCGYHSVGPDGVVAAVNQTELDWLGYSAAELVGRRFAEIVSPASQGTYEAAFARLREVGAVSDVELELVRRDGTRFPALANSAAVRDDDGRYRRSRTTLTDLTERKRTEAALRLFADVAQSVPVGLLIYQLDPDGDAPVLRVRSGNREAERLLGVPLESAGGRPVVEVFTTVPEEQLRRYAAVASTGRPDDFGAFRYGDARVAERWWTVLAFPLPDRSVGVAFQDVTGRKQAEAEVQRLNAELEDRVRARTAELEAANRELGQRNAENEMFVYSVSHDLRSPLVNLQGFSRELDKGCQALAALLAEDGVPAGVRDRGQALLGGRMAKAFGFIQAGVMRLSGIIDALLRLSRAGRVEYRPERVDVATVADRVRAALAGTLAGKGAVVTVGDLPPAWADRAAVEQAFANLIGNAAAYLDPARPGVIEVGCLPPGTDGMRAYFVRDNGLGIAAGHQDRIFQPFQRAHPGVGSGEGLGLAIVARVAERHGGRVWVESTVGVGSVFYVTLPEPRG